ncbi:beta-ketoacyl synthase N-terminal-like domain-containing protein [Pseudomonas kilonensis]|uniref:beta-ketoacyl synthase N-terminal-like domain-containing protein n=1 Tax=Pseudomonas kilonensis TaxID=132476 RepID=UPI00155DC39C|nr:beta-ketoacyl synthase N-terminal-like domain-containing protein [Pseudomonas kilonensis]
MNNSTFILGVGGVSNLGCLQAHDPWMAFAPLLIGTSKVSASEFPVSRYITKQRDINSMGLGQKMLVCAAGLALEDARLLGSDLASYDIFMASKIGERNKDVDAAIIQAAKTGTLDINAELSRLRPTHFLAELPNLYSANISIVFGAKGESVTFVGEASASVQAVTHAIEKLSSGQAHHSIVGGVFNGDQEIHDEYVASINRCGSTPIVFGSAATCMVLGSVPTDAIAGISRLERFDLKNLAEIIIENEVSAVSASFHPGISPPAYWFPEDVGVVGVNIADYFGSLFESTLPTQVLFSLLHFKPMLQLQHRKRILLITQVGRAHFEAFLLDVL